MIEPIDRAPQPYEAADAATTERPVLCRFSRIYKSYDGQTQVVENLNMDIYEGEFLTLLGPSGSGKTTTLMMLAGFETPSSGLVEMDGQSIVGVPPYRRNIGMVFQNYALFPHMTVGENLSFPLRMRGVGRAEAKRRVADILETVQLPEVAGRRPRQLSGGQQQRIALARALIFEPRMVLMDEPLGALDKQLREHMQLEIRHLHERLGITVVYVTHDQSEALTMSDRIAVFAEGRIQQVARPSEIYERPANAFVADFIGDNNRLRGVVTGLCAGGVEIDCGGIAVRAVTEAAHAVGDHVLVIFRPENALVAPPELRRTNRLDVQVSERIYLGDHARLRCRTPRGDEVMVKLSNKAVFSAPPAGGAMSLYWDAEDCRALPQTQRNV